MSAPSGHLMDRHPYRTYQINSANAIHKFSPHTRRLYPGRKNVTTFYDSIQSKKGNLTHISRKV